MKIFYCHKNKCSKSLEPKSKYISNFSLRKALCFVFVLFCCLGMWGQTVDKYETTGNFLDYNIQTVPFNDSNSWQKGEVPDVSGTKEIEITLYKNVSLVDADIANFFNTSDRNITVKNGNIWGQNLKLTYGGKTLYISQASNTELEWNNAENWIGREVPVVSGQNEIYIILNADVSLTDDDVAEFFSNGNEKITVKSNKNDNIDGTKKLTYSNTGKPLYISQASNTVLEWNKAENWIGGEVPDVDGEGESYVILNADVSLTDADIAKFFSNGNEKVTVKSNRNNKKLTYDGKKLYISQASDDSDWNEKESWIGGECPNISGTEGVVIFLNGDMYAENTESDATEETVVLSFNESGTEEIHVYFNGNQLDVRNAIKIGSNSESTNNIGNAGNLYLHGNGKMYVEVVEFGKDGDEKSKTWYGNFPDNKLYLKEGLEFYVKSWVSPYHCKADIDNPVGTKFYLNASGLNINWYNDVQNKIVFMKDPIPYGEQTYFKIIDKGGNPFESGKTLSFERASGSTDIEYKYSVKITGSATWELGSQDLSNGESYSVSLPGDRNNETKIELELNAMGDPAAGDGIIITFRTPDGNMDMCEIRYFQGELLWTGASETDGKNFLEPANWSYSDSLDDLKKLLEENEAIIGSGAAHYPEIKNNNIEVKKLTVKNGAQITVESGATLTVTNSLVFEGNSKINAAEGTVVFSGENTSLSAALPEYSTFGTLKIPADKKFTTNSDLHITTSLTNNGTFTAGKVYIEPNGDTATITESTANANESSETSAETNISELICTSQKEKTLNIESSISVDKISLSGKANVEVTGNLTTKNINLAGFSKIDASTGTVTFAGEGSAENPSFVANKPELSKFGNLVVAETAKFYTNSDLHITTSLSNNDTFTAGKVYFDINDSTNEASIIGSAANISELICTSQKGKTLDISGTISVGKIALSGVANQDNSRLTVKSENQTGVIYLGEACENAKFLDLSIDNLPKIEKGNAASQDEIFIKVADSNIPDIQVYEKRVDFYERGWRLSVPLDYTWTGAEDKDWFKSSNWFEFYVPCENSNVTIKKSTFDNYPILTGNPNKLLSLSVEEGASINFAGKDVTATTITNQGEIDFAGSTVNADTITNNGTVKLTGKEVLQIQDIKNGEESTVIYYGTNENAEFSWGGEYKNLVIEDGFSGSFTPSGISFSVANSIKVENGVFTKKDGTKDYVLALGGAVKIENKIDSLTIDSEGDQNYNFGIEFKKLVVLKSNGTINFPENSEKKFKNGLRLETTEDFSNIGNLISENGAISITSAKFENAQSSEISAKSGKMTITATGDFTNSGKIDSSTGLLKITAKSITTFGEIKANSGDFESTEADILFAANSETTFEAGLTVTSAGNFTNSGKLISENGEISITSAKFENAQSSEISANSGKMTISATGDFTNAGTIIASGNLVVNQVENFTNSGNITALGIEVDTTGDFTNEGSFISNNGDISITSASFENTQSSEIAANSENTFTGKLVVTTATDFENKGTITAYGVEIKATGNFKNEGNLISENGEVNITSASFENAQSSELSTKSGKITISATSDFTNAGAITAAGKLVINPVTNFTNTGNITAYGIEIVATRDFTNSGKLISENGEINITSANFENAQSSEISAKSGKMTITATGDFTNSGTIDSSSELLKITAKSITTSGEINAQSGDFESTEADILFTENSETTFEAGLVVTSAGNFENDGNITAYGIEIVATGNFTNSGNLISENGDINITSANFENSQSSEISAKSGKMTISATSDFTNAGAITAAGTLVVNQVENFTNSGNITALGIEVDATGDFTNTRTIIAAGKLLVKPVINFKNTGTITALGVEIEATGNFKNEGSFISNNGEISITSANFENAQSSELSAKFGKITISATSDFKNAGTITASEVEIDATGDFTNSGKIDSSTGLLKITAKSITTSGEIKAKSGDFISTETDILFAENSASTFIAGLTVTSAANFENCGNITASGVEIVATGNFTNSGKLISENGDINITSANFVNAQFSELSANTGKITISATGDFTNAGTITASGTLVVNQVENFTNSGNITAYGVEIEATGNFTNSGTIDSSTGLLKITAKSITTSGEIKAQSGEFISTESDILFAENSAITFIAGLTVTSAGNFENYGTITASGVEIEASGNFKNKGNLISENGEVNITSASFENAQSSEISANTEKITISATSYFTNAGTITASGVEIVVTGNFKNSGSFISENGDINIKSASFENAQSSEISANSGKMTITATGDFTNKGAVTAPEVEIGATGDFTNSGTIDSSSELLKITAKSITTSGEINAQSGEFESTEAGIVFGENSENTFEAGLTVTSAGNFSNSGNISALGVEIDATGDFTNSGKIYSTAELLKITAKSITTSGEINAQSGDFESTEVGIVFAANSETTFEAGFTVTSAGNFENYGTITALGVEIDATGDFTNARKIDSSSQLLKITAKSITTSGEINAQSGEFISTESDILFAENSASSFIAGLTVTSAANFENYGAITALGVEIDATGDFTNSGKIDSSTGLLKITAKSITTSGEIKANSGEFISSESDILFAENSETTFEAGLVVTSAGNFENDGSITAYGVEIEATGNFKNEGSFTSKNGEISIKSASFENAQYSELSANSGKMTITATSDFTNAGNITASGVEIVATGDFKNSGTIDSSSDLLKITAKSITTSGEIKAKSGDFISTETDILFAENSASTFIAGLTVTSAENFTNKGAITAESGAISITSANFENAQYSELSAKSGKMTITVTGDFTNSGKLISKNGDIIITSASFENAQSSEISANKDFVCNVTESFSNAGAITSAIGKVDINTKSFINKNYNLETPAKIKTENGLINVTTSNFENSGDISAYLDFTCAEPEIFTNAGTITSETGKIDVKAQIMENPGSLFAINGKIDIFTELFETTKEIFGKNIDINSQSSIFAGLVKSGAGDIYISSDLLITHPVEFCLGGSLIIGTVENPKNLVISSLDKNQNATEVKFSQNDDLESIETKVIVSGYAIIFNGNVTLSTNIDIANDFVLLNGITSGENSIYRDSITEIDGLFAYNLFGRGDFDFIAFPSDLPFSIEDNKLTTKNLSHEKYNTHFSIAEGKIISVGKNFYCNGVDLGLNTSAEWFLKILGNDVATSAFAECYNASIKNCKVVANTNPEDYAWLSTENAKDETGNTNVAFSKAVLSSTEVSTISDNIIFIKFINELNGKEIKIENSCNEISVWLENFRFNVLGQISEDNPGIQFTGVYANPECTESTDGKGDLSTFYLKYEIPTDGSIDYRWNTDAIGNSYGSEESTDSSGNYKKVIPNIAFERALNASYAGLRDEHKNRLVSVGTDDIGSNPLFTETKDKASPVLIAVTLGQEQHETDASSQHHYDSHNFIDWQFSEPVEFENYPKNGISQIDSVDTSANSENIQATATFGKITNQGNGFVVAGLGSFSSGKITTGSKTGLGEVNAFYRNFALDVDEKGSSYNPKIKPTRLRLSIAGYVEEENPINYKGEIYNNWLGFIDSKNTTIPSGTFTMPSSISTSIIDKRGNRGEAMEQTVVVNDFLNRYDKEKTLYGTWDIDSPVVSSYMKENLTTIEFEEVIPVDFSQSLSAQGLEIHFLDNSSYNQFEGYSNWKWRTKIGWLYKNESTEITLPLDNKGGSRMTFAENKTEGGLRLSSIVDSIEALSCKNLDLEKTITFTTDFSQSTTYEAFFGKSEDLAFDVPYLSLRFSELSKEFSLNNNYELLYSRHDSQGNPIGFITDLAGNLLYDFTVNSPDKNPPKIFLSIGAVHKDKLYIMFSKKLDWKDSNGNADEGKLRRIVKSLSIFDSKGNDTGLIDYKKGSRTKIVTETEKSTGIEISLTRSISYEELKNLYIGVNVFDSRDELIAGDGDKSKEDSISGEHGNFSMLYDLYENPASKDLKHCLSDFAVNALDVLYAYDGRVADEAILAQGVYGGNQWTVTNFTENKDNSSQIISDKDISIVSKIKDPASFEKQDKFSMIADISPNLQSTGSDFEIYTTINPRLWFTDYIKFFSTDPNNSENIEKDNIGSISGKIENIVSGDKNQNITFVLPNHPKNENSLGWGAGNEIQFLFKVFDKDGNPLMVDGNQDGDFEDDVDHSLFAVRLKDENDLTSIDLWSLNIVDILRQKGGVTILNNVINPLNSEECAIEITIPKAGNLTVQVLTLDGNVVKVIQRGRVEEGTYYYKWNGKNISGDSVARGMYFIRVVGPNIEETRKVMVVW